VKKIFAFIMAVLIISFSVLPCADDASVATEESGNYSFAESIPQDEPTEDACSPFCICTCCAGFSITCTSTSLAVFTAPYKKAHSSFNEAGIITVASTIWQPPRFV
jgi:hypothetical protein